MAPNVAQDRGLVEESRRANLASFSAPARSPAVISSPDFCRWSESDGVLLTARTGKRRKQIRSARLCQTLSPWILRASDSSDPLRRKPQSAKVDSACG